jgi:hypothetical protein
MFWALSETIGNRCVKPWIYVCAVVLILFSGLRGDVECDHGNYVDLLAYVDGIWERGAFTTVLAMPHVEPGFGFLMSVSKSISSGTVAIFLMTSCLAVSFNVRAFIRYAPYPFLAALVYVAHAYWYNDFITIRAGLAMSILLFSIEPLMKRNLWQFLGVIAIAMLAQASAAIFLVTWWTGKRGASRRFWIYAIILTAVLGQTGGPVALIKIFVSLKLLPAAVGVYLDWEMFNYSLTLLNPNTLKHLAICALLLYERDWVMEDKYRILFSSIYLTATCWLLALSGFAIIGARGSAILSIVEPIIISMFAASMRSRVFQVGAITAYSAIFVINMAKLPIEPYVIYSSNHVYGLPPSGPPE